MLAHLSRFVVSKKIVGLMGCVALTLGAVVSCSTETPAESAAPSPAPEQAQAERSNSTNPWRQMTAEELDRQWDYILNSPLGVAALNQLAIEGFISPTCEKTFYTNEQYGGFQSLLQVQCPDERGVSTAVGYDEMRVIFNRFESSIESFEVQRVGPENEPEIQLPE